MRASTLLFEWFKNFCRVFTLLYYNRKGLGIRVQTAIDRLQKGVLVSGRWSARRGLCGALKTAQGRVVEKERGAKTKLKFGGGGGGGGGVQI